MRNFTFLILSLSLFFACQNYSAKTTATTPTVEAEQMLLLQKEVYDVPGMAMGLIKDGEVIYTGAHGLQGVGTQAPLTTKSLFHMASVSKPFVATAIVQLVEKGKVDLDEKLTHYLPYFKMADEAYKDITIRQMLSHSSGIPDVDDYEWDKPQYDEGAAERFAKSVIDWDLDFVPGAEYSYSNTAFDILANVIAKTSGMTFEAYMEENIFKPVGMVNSTFYKPDVPEALATQPHIIGDDLQRMVSEVYPYNRRHAPSSTLHSNVEDMLLWAEVNLNKGEINGKRIYSKASYKLLTSPEVSIRKNAYTCLSWFQSDINGAKKYSHSGGDTGYSTYFAFVPKKKAAIVMMLNVDGFQSAYAGHTILRKTIFGDSVNWKGPISYKLKDYILVDGIEKMKAVYMEEKQKASSSYDMAVRYLDNLGYWLIDRDQPKKALEVFKFMVELEPEDSGWPDSVADAYVELDDIPSAIEWYQKALAMNPEQGFSKEKLDALLNK